MSKLSSLPRISREDLPGAPEWVEHLLQPSNEFQEQATQRLNEDLLTGVVEQYKFVHGVEQVIANPLGKKMPAGISNIRCQGLEVDSAGKVTGKLYDLEVASMKWRPIQTRPGQPQRVGVTVKYVLDHTVPYLFARKSANQSMAVSGTEYAITWDTLVSAPTGSTLSSGEIYIASSSQIQVTKPGLYRVEAKLSYASNATGIRYAYQKLTGSIATGAMPSVINQNPVTGDATSMNTFGTYLMSTSDYVQVFGNQTSGGALNVIGNANFDTTLRVTRICSTAAPVGRVTLRFDGGN